MVKHCQRHNGPKQLSTLSLIQHLLFKAEASTSFKILAPNLDNLYYSLFSDVKIQDLKVSLELKTLCTHCNKLYIYVYTTQKNSLKIKLLAFWLLLLTKNALMKR